MDDEVRNTIAIYAYIGSYQSRRENNSKECPKEFPDSLESPDQMTLWLKRLILLINL